MQKRTRSLLEELEIISNNTDIEHIIENRASNVITSAINLIELISKHYDNETSELLERRLLSSIKNKDNRKFTRSLKRQNKD